MPPVVSFGMLQGASRRSVIGRESILDIPADVLFLENDPPADLCVMWSCAVVDHPADLSGRAAENSGDFLNEKKLWTRVSLQRSVYWRYSQRQWWSDADTEFLDCLFDFFSDDQPNCGGKCVFHEPMIAAIDMRRNSHLGTISHLPPRHRVTNAVLRGISSFRGRTLRHDDLRQAYLTPAVSFQTRRTPFSVLVDEVVPTSRPRIGRNGACARDSNIKSFGTRPSYVDFPTVGKPLVRDSQVVGCKPGLHMFDRKESDFKTDPSLSP